MISRRPRLWWGFGFGSAVLLGALGWASIAVYRLEARNAESRGLAQRQEVIRRALWRVDSQLAPIIAMEAARPIETAPVFGPRQSLDTRDFMVSSIPTDRIANESIVSSQVQNMFARGFFVVEPTGSVRATDEQTERVAMALSNPDSGSQALESFADGVNQSPAGAIELTETESSTNELVIVADSELESGNEPPDAATYDFAARKQVADLANQSDRSAAERRSKNNAPAADQEVGSKSLSFAESDIETPQRPVDALNTIKPSAMLSAPQDDKAAGTTSRVEAIWVSPTWPDPQAQQPELVLVRVVETPDGPRSQGVRLDWPSLRAMLESSVTDLLPATSLMPAQGSEAIRFEQAGKGYRLATIPALLVPGGAVAMPAERMTPAFWALLVTWIATLVALIAVALVLHATLRLSDRRARFVGAVTHELRTPLTTFRLYAQMLAGGMVTDESARAEYLGTLERESIRLGEIVENVLEYARLTRRRPGDARPPGERSISPSELIARVRPVLSRRAEQSGMDLIVSVDQSAEPENGKPAICDPRSVERILMNLVENACKYAGPPEGAPDDDADTRVHLDVSTTDRALEVLVADHGAGVPSRQRERVFGEFQRGPGAIESSRPGLGLGLALSRGLAREMGGDLRLVRRRGHGAEFLLTLPLDPQSAPN